MCLATILKMWRWDRLNSVRIRCIGNTITMKRSGRLHLTTLCSRLWLRQWDHICFLNEFPSPKLLGIAYPLQLGHGVMVSPKVPRGSSGSSMHEIAHTWKNTFVASNYTEGNVLFESSTGITVLVYLLPLSKWCRGMTLRMQDHRGWHFTWHIIMKPLFNNINIQMFI